MGFLPVGALLKLSADPGEIVVEPGGTFVVPFSIARADNLTEPLRLELATSDPESPAFTVEPLDLAAGESTAEARIVVGQDAEPGEHRLTLRATVLQDRRYPVVSETSFDVRVGR